MKINPKSGDLSNNLAVEIAEVINVNAAEWRKPENAAVVPEALLIVLANCIAQNYQRNGHGELVRLSAEKLAELVEETVALRTVLQSASELFDQFAATMEANPEAFEAIAAAADRDDRETAERLLAEANPALYKAMHRATDDAVAATVATSGNTTKH